MSRPSALPLACVCAALALVAAGCGGGREQRQIDRPEIGLRGTDDKAGEELGYPAFATKNTTRVGGADPVADAAGVARAVFPSATRAQRPDAVALVDGSDWRAGIVASALMADPIGAPVLLSGDERLPPATASALRELDPPGSEDAGKAQIIRVGRVPRPKGYRTTDVIARNPAALARAVDAFLAAAQGRSSDSVVVVSQDEPELAMPAAGYAAKSGDPVLFVEKDRVPAETRAALSSHQQPKIYVLGGREAVSERAIRELRRLGTVTRVGSDDPVRNAIDFARFLDGANGWGVVDPGHGLVFASAGRPLDAAAAAPLSATGKYGPLLVVPEGDRLPRPLREYLLDIQPGYDKDPVRGVYNHGWIIGDDDAIPVSVQAVIDQHLEIVPVQEERAGDGDTSKTPGRTSTAPNSKSTTPRPGTTATTPATTGTTTAPATTTTTPRTTP